MSMKFVLKAFSNTLYIIMIQAKIIADSKNKFGNRITTMIVTIPRIILAEFNTHRMFSRNSASSRAIPFEKMVKSVKENPFIPIAWQKDHKGMQGTEYFQENETFISENPMDRFANGITKEDGSAVRIIGRLSRMVMGKRYGCSSCY